MINQTFAPADTKKRIAEIRKIEISNCAYWRNKIFRFIAKNWVSILPFLLVCLLLVTTKFWENKTMELKADADRLYTDYSNVLEEANRLNMENERLEKIIAEYENGEGVQSTETE